MELEKLPEDMTSEEKQLLVQYKSNGCPNLGKISEVDVFKWFKLYMSGKTYAEISVITNRSKELILYMAHKAEWHKKRFSYYVDITANIDQKIRKTKMESANTVTSIISALNKYYGDRFNKYLATDDVKQIEDLDTRLLGQYYKSIETLEKIIGDSLDSKGKQNPTVNVNIGGNATIKKIDDNTIEVNEEKEETPANLLELLAQYKKSQDKK